MKPTFPLLVLKYVCAVILCMIVTRAGAQINLVPNPSFEDTAQCPDNFGQIYYATPWYDATNASPEYFNSCTDSIYVDVPQNFWGNQAPRTGNAYCGFGTAHDIVVDGREYLQVQLTSTLTASATYDVEFYVSLADTSSLAVSSIGLYFSSTAITGPMGEVLNVIPQVSNPANNFITDTAGWVLISGTYVANGTENFITIGNFLDDSSTASVPVGWNFYSGAYYYIDDVSVALASENAVDEQNQSEGPEITVYPNPSHGLFTVTSNAAKGSVTVYNVVGAVVYETVMTGPGTEIDLTDAGSGVYFVSVMTEEGVRVERVVVR